MNLVISAVQGHGDQTKEFVQLNVVKACELGEYLLADTTYVNATSVSNLVRNTHWFVDQKLNAGDTVVLFSRAGNSSKLQRADGTMVYYRYWGLARAVWNNTGDAAVLVHIDQWKHSKVK